MVNVFSRRYRIKIFSKYVSFGVVGRYKTAEYCAQHALGGIVDVGSRKCRTEGCVKLASFAVAGTQTVVYCAQHALEGMVDVKNRKCRTEGCGKLPLQVLK